VTACGGALQRAFRYRTGDRREGVLFIHWTTADGGDCALDVPGGVTTDGFVEIEEGATTPVDARAARASAFFCARFSSFAARLSFFLSSRLRFV
jgi:hypothetical protein